ncbi:Pimeloyl-ACP methyl ester carboxylesterase [Arthrobacter alpinus]|uniref:Pimeloyl-ACP methyl ester carboxylesterase n=1 Tax=Arthrobacter alpinus TaxID=656366 RepID=A0A1H5EWZ5_9MICC|nr:alpha/beta fold hydrolase [Arthrobacter alpinus]SED95641.1 Pimeloyl-ACP methyl ester carboxylesterase [Arthrobacter alpinus]
MSVQGKNSTPSASHSVEGASTGLNVAVFDADVPAQLPPVFLIHGFASSIELNWIKSGWVAALNRAGRRVLSVDLPGHGQSTAPYDLDSYTPGKIRADLLQILTDQGVRPLQAGDLGSGVDLIGYSLGSRLAWEFGATQPELVRKMVLGGPNPRDPLAEFDLNAAQTFLNDGTPIADESTRWLLEMAQLIPSNDIFALLALIQAIKLEPFEPADAVPKMPILLVAGDLDERARSMDLLAQLNGKAEQYVIPGRTHNNAVTSREFKDAAIAFLAG